MRRPLWVAGVAAVAVFESAAAQTRPADAVKTITSYRPRVAATTSLAAVRLPLQPVHPLAVEEASIIKTLIRQAAARAPAPAARATAVVAKSQTKPAAASPPKTTPAPAAAPVASPPAAVAAAGPRDTVSVRRAAVTAVTMGMVYFSAGRGDGLKEGAVVTVARLGPKGRYQVAFLSSKSAAAKGDSTAALPAVGDSVEFRPVFEAPAAVVVNTGPDSTRGTVQVAQAFKPRGPRLRGRFGFRYLSSVDKTNGISMKQPGVEVLLDGPLGRGSPIGIAMDIRTRRTSLYRPGEGTPRTEGVMGVYQAALRVQGSQGPVRAVIGRQYAPTLAGVGLFDGLSVDIQKSKWAGGVMAGLAPELGTMAVSTDIKQLGGFFQLRNPTGAAGAHWSVTMGGIGSYAAGGEVNREFAFFQATVFSKTVSAVALQEIDYNRGWKVALGEKTFSPTSTYLSLNLTPSNWVSLNGGLDNRRSVRLYQDLNTPEALFDDRFRMGMWGGAYFTVNRNLRFSGDVRTNTVGGADSLRTTAYSGTMSLDRLTKLGLGLRFRGTRYETPGRGPGTFWSGTFRIAPGNAGAFELTGGGRTETGGLVNTDRTWAGFNTELFFKRSWFLLANYSREWGKNDLTPTTDLIYAGLSYRF